MSLMSPTLPIGGYSYSQGIEKAVEDRWIVDMDTSYEWLSSQLYCGFVYTDLAILRMLYDCLLYTSPSPRDATLSRMPSSA